LVIAAKINGCGCRTSGLESCDVSFTKGKSQLVLSLMANLFGLEREEGLRHKKCKKQMSHYWRDICFELLAVYTGLDH